MSQHFEHDRRSADMRRADTANGEGDPEVGRPTNVLVAVDESETSHRAARVARRLFGDRARYLMVNVGAPKVPMYGVGVMPWGVPYPVDSTAFDLRGSIVAAPEAESATPPMPSREDQAAAEARAVSVEAGMPPSTSTLGAVGDPPSTVLQVAEAEAVDVIVVGAAEGGWWKHLWDPSVTKEVVRESDRPVLVVP